jgi:hypothetical protein
VNDDLEEDHLMIHTRAPLPDVTIPELPLTTFVFAAAPVGY